MLEKYLTKNQFDQLLFCFYLVNVFDLVLYCLYFPINPTIQNEFVKENFEKLKFIGKLLSQCMTQSTNIIILHTYLQIPMSAHIPKSFLHIRYTKKNIH